MTQATILIIDTSSESSLNIARILMPEGLSVLAANTALRAKKMIAALKPSLILADCSVAANPTVWVEEAVRLGIPAQVVALTKRPDFEEAMEWVANGVFCVLAKPLDEERLRRAVSSALTACDTFQSVVEAREPGPDKALAAFYQGLAGQFDVKILKDYVCRTLKTLTGAVRVELDLTPALTDSVSHFESESFGHLNDFGLDIAPSRPLNCRLNFELSVNETVLGEMFLFFERKDDLAIKNRTAMLEITQTISNAFMAVNRYQKAVNLAAKDGLTGLYNRRIFNEVLKREFTKAQRHKEPLSLLSLDLDHFKAVNDNFGHQTGDMVLKAVAKVIAQVARHSDLAARVGGEEFAVILPQTTQEQAFFLAGRLKKALDENGFDLDGTVFHQTVSQGVVDNEHFLVNSPDDMLYWADQALYQAKREGRDSIRLATELSITPVTKDRAYAFQ